MKFNTLQIWHASVLCIRLHRVRHVERPVTATSTDMLNRTDGIIISMHK